MQTPSIGCVVHVIVDPMENNGNRIAAADITRVWHHDEANGRWIVNYRITAEGGDHGRLVTSAALYADEDAALAGGFAPPAAAFWPPRV